RHHPHLHSFPTRRSSDLILEEHGWRVSSYTEDGRVEIETETPAGEDFIVCVKVERFPEQVAMYAQDFDVDEHVALWINAKKNRRSEEHTSELQSRFDLVC